MNKALADSIDNQEEPTQNRLHDPSCRMRLLHTETFAFKEFNSRAIPVYAILSHTWNENEVTFQDMERCGGRQMPDLPAYEKIRKACSVARWHGFDYIWIDTCCIDKTNSSELSEAINSMYRWYRDSAVCYAYLADVQASTDREFSRSRWFSRGWTLQELIPPSLVIFLNDAWREIGTKTSRESIISETTGISATILKGGGLNLASIAERMSWAAKRQTTRIEDVAYCLMGIFGVNMPMLYGGGERAFIRLQEEIIKISDDHSIFAWESQDHRGGLLAGGLLAPSPAVFCRPDIIPMDSSGNLLGAITVNNKGIHLRLLFLDDQHARLCSVILPCSVRGDPKMRVILYLEALSDNMEYFKRHNEGVLGVVRLDDNSLSEYAEKNICVRRELRTYESQSSLIKTAEQGYAAAARLLLENGSKLEPEALVVAARHGHEAVVELLLEKGADPDIPNESGQTALATAAGGGHEAVARLLLNMGGKVDQEALRAAAWWGHEDVARLLLERGCDPNSEDSSGFRPLNVAACLGYEAVARLLLQRGADPNCTDALGGTAVELAVEKGHETVVKLLLEHGGDTQKAPAQVADKRREGPVILLLDNGADPSMALAPVADRADWG